MVDRQTPTVESDEELTREAEAKRETDAESATAREERAPARPDDHRPSQSATPEEASAMREATPPETTTRSEAPPSATEPSARDAALFDGEAARDLQDRWLAIQTEFVDEPRKAVEKAEALVGEVMQTLTDSFARQRRELEASWSGEHQASTEDLRLTIRHYRSFFNRLLSL